MVERASSETTRRGPKEGMFRVHGFQKSPWLVLTDNPAPACRLGKSSYDTIKSRGQRSFIAWYQLKSGHLGRPPERPYARFYEGTTISLAGARSLLGCRLQENAIRTGRFNLPLGTGTSVPYSGSYLDYWPHWRCQVPRQKAGPYQSNDPNRGLDEPNQRVDPFAPAVQRFYEQWFGLECL